MSSAPTASGSARFQSVSDYYYFLHESDNSKMIIYNLVDGYWSVVVSNGSNFSSPSSGQLVNPVTFATIVTYSREGYDDTGRAYPGSGRGIEYATVVTDQRSSLGIATASSLDVSGVVTATKVHIGVDTGFYSEDFVVNGNGRVTGILTIGTGSIVLDPNAKKITGVDEIIVGTATTVSIKQDTQGNIAFEKEDGTEASVGIGTTVSINTTGIITAATLKASTAFYPPIYTTVQRDAGSFNEGAIIFNTTSKKLEFYDGTSWISLPGMSLGLTVALDG